MNFLKIIGNPFNLYQLTIYYAVFFDSLFINYSIAIEILPIQQRRWKNDVHFLCSGIPHATESNSSNGDVDWFLIFGSISRTYQLVPNASPKELIPLGIPGNSVTIFH